MADHDPQSAAAPATANAFNVIRANHGLTFTPDQIRSMNAGTFVLIGPGNTLGNPGFGTGGSLQDYGCIKMLRYGESDTDLVQVDFDSGDILSTSTASNLNDFRLTFKDAACCGHGITACLDETARHLSMVNVYPCECTCDKRG